MDPPETRHPDVVAERMHHNHGPHAARAQEHERREPPEHGGVCELEGCADQAHGEAVGVAQEELVEVVQVAWGGGGG